MGCSPRSPAVLAGCHVTRAARLEATSPASCQDGKGRALRRFVHQEHSTGQASAVKLHQEQWREASEGKDRVVEAQLRARQLISVERKRGVLCLPSGAGKRHEERLRSESSWQQLQEEAHAR